MEIILCFEFLYSSNSTSGPEPASANALPSSLLLWRSRTLAYPTVYGENFCCTYTRRIYVNAYEVTRQMGIRRRLRKLIYNSFDSQIVRYSMQTIYVVLFFPPFSSLPSSAKQPPTSAALPRILTHPAPCHYPTFTAWCVERET